MTLPTYSTGTASVAAGGTVVTGVGGMWSGTNVKQGDFISIGGSDAVLITEVTDATHLKVLPWPDAAKTSQPYIIYQNYVGRVVGVAAAEDVGDMLEMLHVDGLPFIVGVDETVPDPSYGDDGQMAFKPDTGQWWTKTGGAWVSSPGLTSDASKVLKAGDTMTGNLTISKSDPIIALRKSGAGDNNNIIGYNAANPRWQVALGDSTTETGGNAGSGFGIYRFSDAGGFLATTLYIGRSNGDAVFERDLTWTGAPWIAYTPTVTISGGAGTATGRYKKFGKLVAVSIVVTVTSGGTTPSVSIPPGVSGAVTTGYLLGREAAVAGHSWLGQVTGTIQLVRYDNVSAVSAGYVLYLSGVYEVA